VRGPALRRRSTARSPRSWRACPASTSVAAASRASPASPATRHSQLDSGTYVRLTVTLIVPRVPRVNFNNVKCVFHKNETENHGRSLVFRFGGANPPLPFPPSPPLLALEVGPLPPFSLLPCPSLLSFLPSLLLKLDPLKSSYRVWGSALSSPSGV